MENFNSSKKWSFIFDPISFVVVVILTGMLILQTINEDKELLLILDVSIALIGFYSSLRFKKQKEKKTFFQAERSNRRKMLLILFLIGLKLFLIQTS